MSCGGVVTWCVKRVYQLSELDHGHISYAQSEGLISDLDEFVEAMIIQEREK